jgi:hypothetical protein
MIRTDTSDINIYRAGRGRQMVFHFHNYKRTIKRGDQISSQRLDQAWTFLKASKRLARWEELPF